MGVYLNNSSSYSLYLRETKNPYFVDKTQLLADLMPLLDQGNRYVCITRPRRFGKTVAANMLGAFFGKGTDSTGIFDRLSISKNALYREHLNNHNVIYISFNELPRRKKTYEAYIERIEAGLIRDLKQSYPECSIDEESAVWDILKNIYESTAGEKFIFIFDEWDFIFHRDFVSKADKEDFISFLSNLLKDKPYVSLAYMTGILPIAKYSSGSELNMFFEYTMATKEKYSEYFGFTEIEVDELYNRYKKNTDVCNVTRDGLTLWYNGYRTIAGIQLYNPRSVIGALNDNQLGSYWTSTGPYDEISYYVEHNVDKVKDDLALMVAQIPVPSKIQEYAATSMDLSTRDEIFSAMVVYGFLTYENGNVSIPNKELMEKFTELLLKDTSLGYIHRLARESARMLKATKAGDTKTMCEILAYAHDTESPLLSYSDETELTAVVNLVYLSARDTYRVEREDKAGIGYVDFIFYPENRNDDCIILELKVNHTPEQAIQQIKDRKYAQRFQGKLGEKAKYTGRILAVGISYEKATKIHQCRIEVLK